MGKIVALIYGALAYLFGLAALVYSIGFVNGLAVPKTIDTGMVKPMAETLAVDLALLAIFALQHSVMARAPFKRWWTRVVPQPVERSTYVLFSALALALAVDALGADKVWGLMLPSPYTSTESVEDAAASAQALGCRFDTISISDAMKGFDFALAPVLGDRLHGITQENIQSRSRGLILMALSNATGAMLLATGNKSEMAVGYATLYGDMCGGFAVLKDVYKMQVYALSLWRNTNRPRGAFGAEGIVLPPRVLTKAPTAELRPNQRDQDSLPPYEVLDGVLDCLIEQDLGIKETIAQGYTLQTVTQVWNLLHRAEYKRRQAPPGVKITRRNLGRDRRYPMTNSYTGK